MKQLLIFVVSLLINLGCRQVSGSMYKVSDAISKAYINKGDIMIGVVIPLHFAGNHTACSRDIREFGALQRLEAVAYAVDEINKNQSVLPGNTLGFVAFDDCSNDQLALAQMLHFTTSNLQDHPNNCTKLYDVIGIIGAESSHNSMRMADMLSILQIPQLSYLSTSSALSDTRKYPMFSRIVPPDNHQVQALIDLLRHFEWTYVSLMYSDDAYGRGFHKDFRKLMKDGRPPIICQAASIMISQHTTTNEYDLIVGKLSRESGPSRVVILITPLAMAKKLFHAVQRNGSMEGFTWLGGDSWGRNIQDYDGLENVAKGALTMKLASRTVKGFDSHMKNLLKNPAISQNPWLVQFAEEYFPSCKVNATFGHQSQCVSKGYHEETTTSLVFDAVWALALAANETINSGNLHNGKVLWTNLVNVSFMGTSEHIGFTKSGDGLLDYDIQNLQIDSSGQYNIVKVGEWKLDLKKLQLTVAIQWNVGNTSVSSVCNAPCSRDEGQIGIQSPGQPPSPCCYECKKCAWNEYIVQRPFNRSVCMPCPAFYIPSRNRSSCFEAEPLNFCWTHPVKVSLVVVACVGVLTTLLVSVVFIKNGNARLIKSTSRELSAMVLFGILLGYLFVFVYTSKPSGNMCYVRHQAMGLGFVTTYAPLVVKINTIYRIFNSKNAVKVKRTEPHWKILFSSLIILTEVIIQIIWSQSTDMGAEKLQIGPNKVELICKIPLAALLMHFGYSTLLVAIVCYYAYKTRRLPTNYNETKFICVSAYCTIVLWITFIPVYFNSESNIHRSSTLSVASIVSASTFLIGLYIPKVFALYCSKPDDEQELQRGNSIQKW